MGDDFYRQDSWIRWGQGGREDLDEERFEIRRHFPHRFSGKALCAVDQIPCVRRTDHQFVIAHSPDFEGEIQTLLDGSQGRQVGADYRQALKRDLEDGRLEDFFLVGENEVQCRARDTRFVGNVLHGDPTEPVAEEDGLCRFNHAQFFFIFH